MTQMAKRELLVSVAALFVLAVTLPSKADKNSGAAIGQPAPTFSLHDQDGKTVSLDDYKGKIVVLEWFNNGCPYVVRHYEKLNSMNSLAKKYAEQGVAWVAINSTRNKSEADNKQAAQAWHIDRPILADTTTEVAKSYGAKTTPHMFIIDKQGKIAYEGAIDNDPDGNKGADKINYVDKALTELSTGSSVSVPETRSYGCGVHYR